MEEQFILNNFDKENPNNLFLFNDHLTKQNDFNGSHCSLKFLQISIWFVTVLDIVLAILAIILNSLLIPSSLNSRPIPFRTRRFLSSISLNYALLASILLTKKCFWLYFSFVNPKGHCIPTFTSSTCKLQEFPLVFIYIYSMILPLIFALQMAFKRWFRKNKKEDKIINFNNQRKIIIQNSSRQSRRVKKLIIQNNNNNNIVEDFRHSNISETEFKKWKIVKKQQKYFPFPYWLCSTKQIILIVFCCGITLFFTSFDRWDEISLKRKRMANCSITLAIRQKGLAFGLLSLILISQLLQSLVWYFIPLKTIKNNKKSVSYRHSSIFDFLVFSCRDLFLIEAILWSLVALLTGIALFQQYVLTSPCNKCTQLAVEFPFTTLPLFISLLHPILSLILIAPIRYTAQRFFPIFAKLLPTQEPITPPLPRPFPSVRILVTEH